MQECGIFVPSQDASWELVPNAFQELLYRHNRCDAQECQCPQGRDYNSSTNSSWEMVLCRTCGSQGTHVRCTNLKWAKSWDCNDCVSILSKKFSETTTRINGTVPHDIDVNIDSDDEDSSRSVTKALELASINLKPGPRSAKLKQLHQTAQQLTEPTTIQQLKSILDEQQAVPGSSDTLRNNSEEDEISILEVRKVTPQNSPEKILQAVKYPELSIQPRKSLPETSNQKQNDVSIFRSNDSQRLNSVPGTVPGTSSRTSVPGTSVPGTVVPGTSSRTSVPGTFVPLTPGPGTIVGGTFVPRTLVPGTSVPRTSVPGISVHGTSVPGISVHGISVPGTNIDGTSVPRTWVPGTIVNGTSVPRTSVPGTDVPRTPVPGTDVPRTIVPGTDVPRTIVPGTDSIQEPLEGTARCRQDIMLNKSNQGSKSNKIIEDVIVVDSDDENDGTTAQPAEELASQSQNELLNPDDGLMNIKILDVTSLAPEEFARVPDNSTNVVNDLEPVQNSESNLSFSTSESITSESSSGAFSKRKADSPSVLSTLVDRVNNVIDTNTRELMRASLPPKKPRYGPNNSASGTTTDLNPTAPTTPTTPSVSNFATGMTRIVPPSNYMQNHVVSYAGGISLANSAVIKFCDKQYILPLGPPNNAATMSSGGNDQQITAPNLLASSIYQHQQHQQQPPSNQYQRHIHHHHHHHHLHQQPQLQSQPRAESPPEKPAPWRHEFLTNSPLQAIRERHPAPRSYPGSQATRRVQQPPQVSQANQAQPEQESQKQKSTTQQPTINTTTTAPEVIDLE
ncbi:Similar to G2e3: G2/M phase-specific E3 ubiquitin-protein ligase (Mus musculus) [Cotesia congregata]|uniref:Similar to G2e3: G2/M phase-specific E3 ubiquitin-protein ligase (Mus musculus) n=1 Tax=Cotesia congregata TaxID=51543 RepID=A0A8J2EN03_COTCN|nr:Similar to G2e3: G2/M phase-specific E3 ubiquitin-protein ligase (Mus musculus) [Cotesia congregata]